MDFVLFPIASINLGDRFRQDLGDIDSLALSIEKHGLLHPVVITPDHLLVAGQRRIRACQDLGWDEIPAVVVDIENLIEAEHDENECRKQFTISERVAIAEAIKKAIGNRHGKRTDLEDEDAEDQLQEFFPEVPTAAPGQQTREIAAKTAGLGNETTFRQAKKVVEKGTDAVRQAMDEGIIKPSAAAKLTDLTPKAQEKVVEEIREGAKPSTAIAKAREKAGLDTPRASSTTTPKAPTQEETQAVYEQWKDAPLGTTKTSTEEGQPSSSSAKIFPPTLVDGWGIPIQNHAKKAFESLPKFKALLAAIQTTQKLFNELAEEEGGKFLTMPGVSSYRRGKKKEDGTYDGRFIHEGIERAYQQVKAAVPSHTVCPYNYADGPHPEDCTCCCNLNWTPVLGSSIPPICIDRAKKAFGVQEEE